MEDCNILYQKGDFIQIIQSIIPLLEIKDEYQLNRFEYLIGIPNLLISYKYTYTFPLIGYALYRVGNPLWFSLSNVFMGVFFFELGRAWRRILSWLPQRAALYISTGLIACFIVGNFLFHDAAYTMSSNRFDGDFLPVIINMVCVLCGLSGLLITSGVRRAPVINYIGEHSMVFFVGHFPILFYYKYMHLAFGRSIYGRYDDVLILLPAVLMICAWLVPFVERYPVLSGRWKK